jgi:hypothetical protein
MITPSASGLIGLIATLSGDIETRGGPFTKISGFCIYRSLLVFGILIKAPSEYLFSCKTFQANVMVFKAVPIIVVFAPAACVSAFSAIVNTRSALS